jgi:FkbM family methyltransferase
MVWLDIGSHYGEFTMELASYVGPTGWVYAVEPNPKLVDLTKETMELNSLPWYEIDQLAVTAKSGTVSFEETLSNSIAARVVD